VVEHLKALSQGFRAKTRDVVLALGVADGLVRLLEIPRMPMDDFRLVLKHNSRAFLQQDLTGYTFDYLELAAAAAPKGPGAGAPGAPKQRIVLAGAKQQLVTDLANGARAAGLALDSLVPGIIGPVNAFELAHPEIFQEGVVVLVDIGFRHSSICLLQKGELVLNRVVALGGDQLTVALSESMSIGYAEAEGLKIGMAREVQFALESVLVPLGQELRASLDFFEHQQDQQVTEVYLTGGSAYSEVLVQILQNVLSVECKKWDPTRGLQKELPAEQAAAIEEVSPQLAVAVGAALAAL